MKCPKCQHENPSDARFCNGCGQKLEVACPECGKTNPLGSRFCNGCGFDLSKPFVSNESSESSQEWDLPPDTSERTILPEGERRQATVVFSDLSGYTAMNEQLDPEEVQGIM